jgi:hypothetical protein
MTKTLVAALLATLPATAYAKPPLHDPVALNIGLSCQWQARCIAKQKRAMKRSLTFVKTYQPASWRIELCNRNAARRGFRVDWVGFENCIRNAALRQPQRSRVLKKRQRNPT